MKVNAAIASYFPTIPRNQEVASSKTPAVSASDKASNNPPDESGIKRADFTNMSVKEMRDWVNNQILSGKMSLDDSTSFVGLTIMDFPLSPSIQSAGYSADTTHYNFMELARGAIESDLSHNNQVSVKSMQTALNIMTKNQGLATGVNTTA